MIAVRQYEFRATVALDPSARAEAVRRLLEARRTHCVVHPCDTRWFPATISVCRSRSRGRQARAIVRVHLLAGEQDAFFATGQPFTLWADAIVDDETIRGEGLLGDGIVTNEWAAGDHEDPRTTARPGHPCDRTAPQRLGVGASAMAAR